MELACSKLSQVRLVPSWSSPVSNTHSQSHHSSRLSLALNSTPSSKTLLPLDSNSLLTSNRRVQYVPVVHKQCFAVHLDVMLYTAGHLIGGGSRLQVSVWILNPAALHAATKASTASGTMVCSIYAVCVMLSAAARQILLGTRKAFCVHTVLVCLVRQGMQLGMSCQDCVMDRHQLR